MQDNKDNMESSFATPATSEAQATKPEPQTATLKTAEPDSSTTPKLHVAELNTGVPAASSAKAETKKEQNIPLGTVGAILGSMAGAVSIILLDRLGYVASVSGLIMAIATIWLYQKLAKGISGKGIAICIVVMVVMVLVAENIACSITIIEEIKETGYDYIPSFGEVFNNFFRLLSEGYIRSDVYFGRLALVYLFTALGAFGVIKSYK